jgi:hypothetical protein
MCLRKGRLHEDSFSVLALEYRFEFRCALIVKEIESSQGSICFKRMRNLDRTLVRHFIVIRIKSDQLRVLF